MDYKNFFLRFIISIILLVIYFFLINSVNLLFIFGTLIYLITLYEVLKYFKNYIFIIITYLLISFYCFYFYLYYYFDIYNLNLLVYVLVIFDSFSYLVGNVIGKTKIIKKISPGKTLEGYIGGVFFTNIFYVFYFLANNNFTINIHSVFLINLMIISSLIGDLLESYFKRANALKNSSNLLPGHGGFFDRFDSFMLTIIILTFYSAII